MILFPAKSPNFVKKNFRSQSTNHRERGVIRLILVCHTTWELFISHPLFKSNLLHLPDVISAHILYSSQIYLWFQIIGLSLSFLANTHTNTPHGEKKWRSKVGEEERGVGGGGRGYDKGRGTSSLSPLPNLLSSPLPIYIFIFICVRVGGSMYIYVCVCVFLYSSQYPFNTSFTIPSLTSFPPQYPFFHPLFNVRTLSSFPPSFPPSFL